MKALLLLLLSMPSSSNEQPNRKKYLKRVVVISLWMSTIFMAFLSYSFSSTTEKKINDLQRELKMANDSLKSVQGNYEEAIRVFDNTFDDSFQ